MNQFWLDFVTGWGLMNAMPHFIFGITKTRFLSAFGFTAEANLLYAAMNFVIAIAAFYVNHGFGAMSEHGVFLGACFILVTYFITGKMFYRMFHLRTRRSNQLRQTAEERA